MAAATFKVLKVNCETNSDYHFYSIEEKVPITSFYSLKNFQESLADRFVVTVASTPDNPVIKMFLFAQHVSEVVTYL